MHDCQHQLSLFERSSHDPNGSRSNNSTCISRWNDLVASGVEFQDSILMNVLRCVEMDGEYLITYAFVHVSFRSALISWEIENYYDIQWDSGLLRASDSIFDTYTCQHQFKLFGRRSRYLSGFNRVAYLVIWTTCCVSRWIYLVTSGVEARQWGLIKFEVLRGLRRICRCMFNDIFRNGKGHEQLAQSSLVDQNVHFPKKRILYQG